MMMMMMMMVMVMVMMMMMMMTMLTLLLLLLFRRDRLRPFFFLIRLNSTCAHANYLIFSSQKCHSDTPMHNDLINTTIL